MGSFEAGIERKWLNGTGMIRDKKRERAKGIGKPLQFGTKICTPSAPPKQVERSVSLPHREIRPRSTGPLHGRNAIVLGSKMRIDKVALKSGFVSLRLPGESWSGSIGDH